MNRDWKVTKAYAEVCLSVGREYSERNGQGEECQVDVVDTWGIMMKKVEGEERTLEEFLKDGVHLAGAGNDVSFCFYLRFFAPFSNYFSSPVRRFSSRYFLTRLDTHPPSFARSFYDDVGDF